MLSCSALRTHELLRGHHGGKRTLQQIVCLHQCGLLEFARKAHQPQSAGTAEYEGVRFPAASRSVHALTTPVPTESGSEERGSCTVYRSFVEARACRQAFRLPHEAHATVNPFCACWRRPPLLESLADQIQQPGPCGPRNAKQHPTNLDSWLRIASHSFCATSSSSRARATR